MGRSSDEIWSDLALWVVDFGASCFHIKTSIFFPFPSSNQTHSTQKIINKNQTTFFGKFGHFAHMGVATDSQFHVLAVDDSIIDRKLIERLLKVSSFQGNKIFFLSLIF